MSKVTWLGLFYSRISFGAFFLSFGCRWLSIASSKFKPRMVGPQSSSSMLGSTLSLEPQTEWAVLPLGILRLGWMWGKENNSACQK